MTNLKKYRGQHCCESQRNSRSGHLGQENVNAFLANAGWLTCIFQKTYSVKMLNLQVRQVLKIKRLTKNFKNIVLIIHRFCICTFSYLLKFICNSPD